MSVLYVLNSPCQTSGLFQGGCYRERTVPLKYTQETHGLCLQAVAPEPPYGGFLTATSGELRSKPGPSLAVYHTDVGEAGQSLLRYRGSAAEMEE